MYGDTKPIRLSTLNSRENLSKIAIDDAEDNGIELNKQGNSLGEREYKDDNGLSDIKSKKSLAAFNRNKSKITSCARCKNAKEKCSKTVPCSHCWKRGVECVWLGATPTELLPAELRAIKPSGTSSRSQPILSRSSIPRSQPSSQSSKRAPPPPSASTSTSVVAPVVQNSPRLPPFSSRSQVSTIATTTSTSTPTIPSQLSKSTFGSSSNSNGNGRSNKPDHPFSLTFLANRRDLWTDTTTVVESETRSSRSRSSLPVPLPSPSSSTSNSTSAVVAKAESSSINVMQLNIVGRGKPVVVNVKSNGTSVSNGNSNSSSNSIAAGASNSVGAGGSNSIATERKKKRNRRITSCEKCRNHKLKCSRTQPCTSCSIRNEKCVWLDGAVPNILPSNSNQSSSSSTTTTTTELSYLRQQVKVLTSRLVAREAQDIARGIIPTSISSVPLLHDLKYYITWNKNRRYKGEDDKVLDYPKIDRLSKGFDAGKMWSANGNSGTSTNSMKKEVEEGDEEEIDELDEDLEMYDNGRPSGSGSGQFSLSNLASTFNSNSNSNILKPLRLPSSSNSFLNEVAGDEEEDEILEDQRMDRSYNQDDRESSQDFIDNEVPISTGPIHSSFLISAAANSKSIFESTLASSFPSSSSSSSTFPSNLLSTNTTTHNNLNASTSSSKSWAQPPSREEFLHSHSHSHSHNRNGISNVFNSHTPPPPHLSPVIHGNTVPNIGGGGFSGYTSRVGSRNGSRAGSVGIGLIVNGGNNGIVGGDGGNGGEEEDDEMEVDELEEEDEEDDLVISFLGRS